MLIKKYSSIVTKFAKKLTHPKREEESSLGNLIADIFAQNAQCDVMFVGSGSIRKKELGPVVTLQDLMACFPYDDSLTRYTVTGENLKQIFNFVMRPQNRNSEGECYQANNKVRAEYDDKKQQLISLKINNKEVENKKTYTLCLQGYHASNAKQYLNISEKELIKSGKSKVVTTSAFEVLEEYLRKNQNLQSTIEGRLIYH